SNEVLTRWWRPSQAGTVAENFEVEGSPATPVQGSANGGLPARHKGIEKSSLYGWHIKASLGTRGRGSKNRANMKITPDFMRANLVTSMRDAIAAASDLNPWRHDRLIQAAMHKRSER